MFLKNNICSLYRQIHVALGGLPWHYVLPLPLRMDVWQRFFQLSRHMAATIVVILIPTTLQFNCFHANEFGLKTSLGSYFNVAFPLATSDIQGGCVSKTTQMVHQHLAPVMSSYSLMVAVEDIWWFDSLTLRSWLSFQLQFASLTYLAGNKNAITTLKRGGDAVQKSEKTLLVIYDEESIIARLGLPAAKKSPNIFIFSSPAKGVIGSTTLPSSKPRQCMC